MRKLSFVFKVILTSAAVIALSLSCTRHEDELGLLNKEELKTLESLRQSLPEALCVYDPAEYFPDGTKGGSEEAVSVGRNALDYDHASFLSTEKYDYIQVPVHANTPLSCATVRFPEFTDGSAGAEAGEGKTFLVVQTAKDSASDSRINIVTIIPHPNFMREGELDSLDFFYKGYFNAVFFYSDLDGRITKVETYVHGIPYRLGHVAVGSALDDLIVSVAPESGTKGTDPVCSPVPLDNWLNAIYVVADAPDNPSGGWTNDDDIEYPWLGETQWPNEGIGGGSGGDGDREEGESGYSPTITVRINVVGRGLITGTGSYNFWEMIRCTASPLSYGETETSEFIGWSGYITSAEPSITFILDPTFLSREISLTATFHNYSPCATGEKRDPLLEMEILGTLGSGIKGGTFGDSVRRYEDGSPKSHSGIDLSCPIGTPVFSTTSGVVVAIRTGFKNNVSWKEYSGKASRRTFNAGNSVYILSSINGQSYTMVYWHLSEVLVKTNDRVEVGTIIGTSGNTGNASDSGSAGPHLHYQVQDSNGERLDPEEFIYTIFGDDGKQTNPCN